jgi:hypothetical protein
MPGANRHEAAKQGTNILSAIVRFQKRISSNQTSKWGLIAFHQPDLGAGPK